MDPEEQRWVAGKTLRIARSVKDLSQRELARLSGVGLKTVVKFEHGRGALAGEETARIWTVLASVQEDP